MCVTSRSMKVLSSLLLLCAISSPVTVFASGGVSVQGTRIIYPLDASQNSLTINNSSKTDSFLVQSWVETSAGSKTQDFVVTPPLYLSRPGNENVLHLINVRPDLPKDRESLYYYIAKAIPSIDKTESHNSVLRIATATRIKLFVRPSGMLPARDNAPSLLSFSRVGHQLKITNPTPYYLTLTEIKSGGAVLNGTMVAPQSSVHVALPEHADNQVTFRTINDFGAITKPIKVAIK